MPINILTINAGSSSIKYKVYEFFYQKSHVLLSGLIEGIGEKAGSWSHQRGQSKEQEQGRFANHELSFELLGRRLKEDLTEHPIHGVGHRVVHGGNLYFKPTRITEEVLKNIRALSQLAPLHNPINAAGIDFALYHFASACQLAVFDTGFHHNMPDFIRNYAINSQIAKEQQIQRYGFHGINHEYVAIQAAQFLNKDLKDTNLISLHLGNGASSCLIKEGRSFDTSMGMTPLAGLIMGTRSGDIDPAIPTYLIKQGMALAEVEKLLNKESGLKGIANDNDMRNLIARAQAEDKEAKLAIDMYVYAIQKTIGAHLSQANSLDALIFTGGVGENATLIREKILEPLKHLGFALDHSLNQAKNAEACRRISKTGKDILIIRGDEEALIADKVLQTLDPAGSLIVH